MRQLVSLLESISLAPGDNKETTLERGDFALQLLIFVTTEKEICFYNFLSLQFLPAVVPVNLGQDGVSASGPWKLRPNGLEARRSQLLLI